MRISDWSSTCALPIWPGIVPIYETLAAIEHKAVEKHDDKTLWNMALEGKDDLAVAALDRFCLALGAVAGDLALAHGPKGVVIAGGLGLRLKDHLLHSGDRKSVVKGKSVSGRVDHSGRRILTQKTKQRGHKNTQKVNTAKIYRT